LSLSMGDSFSRGTVTVPETHFQCLAHFLPLFLCKNKGFLPTFVIGNESCAGITAGWRAARIPRSWISLGTRCPGEVSTDFWRPHDKRTTSATASPALCHRAD
jgi:hypothetical protein